MLVLSRQRDETIMIGDDVQITVVDIRGDKVRLGITAPREIQVHRKEVYDAIKRENQQASRLNPGDVPEVGKNGDRSKRSQIDSQAGDRESRSPPHAETGVAKDKQTGDSDTLSDSSPSKSTDGGK